MSWIRENRLPLLVALFLVTVIIAVGASNRLTGSMPLGQESTDRAAAAASDGAPESLRYIWIALGTDV